MRRYRRYERWPVWSIALLLVALFVSLTNWSTTGASDGNKTSIALTTLRPQSPPRPLQDGGDWSPLSPTQQVPVHISVLPDGRIFYWGRDKHADGWDIGGRSSTYYVDPLYMDDPRYTTVIDPPEAMQTMLTTNVFCAGHSFLPDGRLLVTGGHKRDNSSPSKEGIGEDTINIFDYRTNLWTLSGHMEKGRWYPFNVTLASGETLIASGTFLSSTSPSLLANDEPTIRKLDGSLKTLRADDNFEEEMQHPYISLTPNNKVFSARSAASKNAPFGPHLLDPNATRPNGESGVAEVLDSRPAEVHLQGTSVQYAPGKVLLVGGVATGQLGGIKSKKAEIIDLNAAVPTWATVADLSTERLLPNSTLLPDGKVLVTGGTNCAGYNNVTCGSIQTPELWDPTPKTWTAMNPSPNGEPRVYHSIAMLMPDGRVMVGGGGLPAAKGEIAGTTLCDNTSAATTPEECRRFGHKTVDFFSPPYLYDSTGQPAVRPAIASGPESIAYGQQFTINVGNVSPTQIKDVVLIRLPSVTHTYNQDQRRVSLGGPVSINGLNITVNAPSSGNACPPGPYMMFLISNNGRNTPSVAKIVRVGDLSISSSTSFFNAGQTFLPDGGNGTVTVNAAPGVSWLAEVITPNTPWLAIQNGSGTANGSFNLSVAANVAPANGTVPSRWAIIRVGVQQRDAVGIDYLVYQAGNFIDVQPTSPLFPFISKIYARNVTAGCGPQQFCPEGTLTRGEGAVFISALLHPQALPTPLTVTFQDVPTNHNFARFIEYMARRKIIDGCTVPGNFCINQPLTRKDMIVWLVRALGVNNPPKTIVSSFGDVSKDDPASPFIEEGLRRGITAGCGGGNYCPNASITRGQMAVFFTQTFGL